MIGTRLKVGEGIISWGKNGEFRIGVIELSVDLVGNLSALQKPYKNTKLATLFQYFCDIHRRRRPRSFRRRLPIAATEEEEEEDKQYHEREEAINHPFLSLELKNNNNIN